MEMPMNTLKLTFKKLSIVSKLVFSYIIIMFTKIPVIQQQREECYASSEFGD